VFDEDLAGQKEGGIMANVTAGFDAALDFVLGWEGKITENVPGDPGGATKWGITQLDYDDYRRGSSLPLQTVFKATETEIRQIYRAHYWTPLKCDQMPYNVALVLFDTSVNVGVTRATRWLKLLLGIPSNTDYLFALNNYLKAHGAAALLASYLARRDAYYCTIGKPGKTLNKFLQGWLNRTADLRRVAGVTTPVA